MYVDALDPDTPLSFESPESSSIVQASYDPDTLVLTVQFRRDRDAPDIWVYTGIQPQLWTEFLEAGSKGHYFASRIRPLHPGKVKR